MGKERPRRETTVTIRLILVVEGHTEEAFANDMLRPHLAGFGVDLSASRVETKRGGLKGGMTTYARARGHLVHWMKQERKNADARFSTMFDLYGLPDDFPDFKKASAQRDPLKRAALLEAAFQRDIGDRRFIAYIQVHEFEALLFADIEKLVVYFPERASEVDELREEARAIPTPEHIDDGEETTPSKRIVRRIPEYKGLKPVAGPIIASKIGLPKLRAECVHFGQWLTRCEALAGSPPAPNGRRTGRRI